MKNKTALQQLIQRYEKYIFESPSQKSIYEDIIKTIKKFSEIEKDQIRKAFNQGGKWASEISSEEYYNQEYNNEEL